MPYDETVNRLNLTAAALRPLEEAGLIRVEVVEKYRNPLLEMKRLLAGERKEAAEALPAAGWQPPVLNEQQRMVSQAICRNMIRGFAAPA